MPSLGNKFTEYFFISFKYKLSNVHLDSRYRLVSNSKELSLASDAPFSAKSRLVKIFAFLLYNSTRRVSFCGLSFWGIGSTKSCNSPFGFWRSGCQKPWWMVFTVSYLFVSFTDIPVCRQLEILLVTRIDLNTMFFDSLAWVSAAVSWLQFPNAI